MLKEMIEQAEVETGAAGIEQLEYVIDAVATVSEIGDVVLEAIELTEMFGPWQAAGIAVGTVGVLAQYVGVWLQLGGAHAEAQAEIAKDHLKRGFSYGVVLGGNGAGQHYVYDHFWLQVPPNLPFYPEFSERAQNLQNAGLVAGYSEGKRLSPEEMRAFMRDIRSRMSEADQSYFDYESVPWKDWRADKKKEFYTTAAAVFRRDHLE
jgi:hypothetical protein